MAGGLADFGEGGFELGGGVGFDVEEKLVFPGAAVDGTTLDFLEVDAVFGEGLERGEKCAGAVGEAHGDGHFVGAGRRRRGLGSGAEKKKAREILGVVLNVGGEDDGGVVFGGAAAGDGSGGFVAAREDFADAAGGVFGGNAFQVGMSDEETFALREGHGMACDGAEVVECGAGAADEVMLDGENRLGGDGEGAFKKEVVDADDGAGEGVFYGGQEGVGEGVGDGAEGGVEGGAGDGGNGFAEELDRGGFAERAGLALEGDT